MRKENLLHRMECLLLPFTFVCIFFIGAEAFADLDPDINRNVSELISSKGYPVEDHVVQTSDGYILSVQRIPYGREGQNGSRPAVFVQHGLFSSSAEWVLNFPNESLGFILADAGYDVWMGNNRGNTYSKKHVTYDIHSKKFWSFSFQEMGQYDLPAMIDHVLNVTGQDHLLYVGHSQGTSQAFAMLSEKPEYNDKVKLFVAMAPVTTLSHLTHPIKYLSPYWRVLRLVMGFFGRYEFLPDHIIVKESELMCGKKHGDACEDLAYLMFSRNMRQLNVSRIPVYAAHCPAGSSMKCLVHFAQIMQSKKFEKFDYGWIKNLFRYGQASPPEYDLSKITTPIALFSAKKDNLADPEDVAQLRRRLRNVAGFYVVPDDHFTHTDFTNALEGKRLVYDEVLKYLKNYS